MIYDAALTNAANTQANTHLLQHYAQGEAQEDLCFALWRPSTGGGRTTAVIKDIIPPQDDERLLHGNASFNPAYLGRSIRLACQQGAGLAFMHSHPSAGWQDMSLPDIKAEQSVIAYPAAATGLPLVGLTVGRDGYWSARFWIKENGEMHRYWCGKVRVVGPKQYRIFYNDDLLSRSNKKNILRRTIESWGEECQQKIARMKICVVGLGSVGAIVAEALARIGVADIVLIDPDKVEEHNLDRLLNASKQDIGKYKVALAESTICRNATADKVKVHALALPVQETSAYKAAIDCDFLFSCVDRPLARDVLNHIANAHLIPVVDGGIDIKRNSKTEKLNSAHWKAHLATPYHRCLRCNGQYDSSMVVMELDGSLDDPSYIANLPKEERPRNQNVFPFSLSVASMEVNLMLRYVIGDDWWPTAPQQDYQFITGKITTNNEQCNTYCSVNKRAALGDMAPPLPYLTMREKGTEETNDPGSVFQSLWVKVMSFYKFFWKS